MDLSIVIPCYNEVDNVDKIDWEHFPMLAQMARTRSIEVVFVDDGGKDGTYDAFSKAFGAQRRRHHPLRASPGERTGSGHPHRLTQRRPATSSSPPTATAPTSSTPSHAGRLTDGVDIVTASPYHPDGEVVGVPRLSAGAQPGIVFHLPHSARLAHSLLHCALPGLPAAGVVGRSPSNPTASWVAPN
ncbi:MAG: hypothetical protein R2873_26715 [Caldilineaceae bacterium]